MDRHDKSQREGDGWRKVVEDFTLPSAVSGFRLIWRVQDHWADVEAYEIIGVAGQGQPQFQRAGAAASPDCVDSTDEAELYLNGYIKWDGCTELDMGGPHWCGGDGWQAHLDLLRHIWKRAYELMGREQEFPWIDREEKGRAEAEAVMSDFCQDPEGAGARAVMARERRRIALWLRLRAELADGVAAEALRKAANELEGHS